MRSNVRNLSRVTQRRYYECIFEWSRRRYGFFFIVFFFCFFFLPSDLTMCNSTAYCIHFSTNAARISCRHSVFAAVLRVISGKLYHCEIIQLMQLSTFARLVHFAVKMHILRWFREEKRTFTSV